MLLDLSKDRAGDAIPSDSISDLRFYGSADADTSLLSVSSWDGTVRLYEVDDTNGHTRMALTIEQSGPVLSSTWMKRDDRPILITGGGDCQIAGYDLNSATRVVIGGHNDVVSSVRAIDAHTLASCSWDGTIKFWDIRDSSAGAYHTVRMDHRGYCMDVKRDQLVVCGSNHFLGHVDLGRNAPTLKVLRSTLKGHARDVSLSHCGKWFAVGGSEWMCSITELTDSNTTGDANFNFKCHRKPRGTVTEIYAVNALAHHPITDALVTAGSDGSMSVWDKPNRRRICEGPVLQEPVSTVAFSPSGNVLCYACSYDWSKGHSHNSPDRRVILASHCVRADEIRLGG